MPAPPLSHTFESGLADGTAITVTNSATGGNAFQVVTGSPTATYSTTHVKNGTLAAKFDPGATSSAANAQWTGLGSITTDLWGRFYLWLPSIDATKSPRLVRIGTSTAASGFLALTTTGKLQALNAVQNGSTAGTVTVATAQWVRVEFRIKPSASVGEIEWWLYNTADAPLGSHSDHVPATGLALGANSDQVSIGLPTATQNPASWAIWMDDIALSTTGQIGPVGGTSGTIFAPPMLATAATPQLVLSQTAVPPAAAATASAPASSVTGPATVIQPPPMVATASFRAPSVGTSAVVVAAPVMNATATVRSPAVSQVSTGGTYSVVWNAAGAASGTHAIQARAIDTAGNIAASSIRTVTVTGGLPTGTSSSHFAQQFPTVAFEVDFTEDLLALPWAAAVLQDSPYFFLRLADPSGTVAADSSGNNRAGSISGTPTFRQPSPAAADGYAIRYPTAASTNRVAGTGTDTNLANPLPNGASFEAWVKFEAWPPSGGAKLFGSSQDPTAGGGYDYPVIDSTGHVQILSTGISRATSAAALSLNTWYHVVWNLHANPAGLPVDYGGHFYVNGAEFVAFQNGGNDGNMGSGRNLTYSAGPVSFAEFAYYETQLTPNQIAGHYLAGDPTYTGLPTAFTDQSSKVRGFSVTRGRDSETDRINPGQHTVDVEDTTRSLEPDYPGSPYYPDVRPQRYGRLRATLGSTYGLAGFFIPTWPVDWTLRRGLATLEGVDLYGVLGTWKFSSKVPQEPTGARVNRVLDRIGWPASRRLVDPGQQIVVAETVTDAAVGAYLQLIADTEGGLFFIDGDGNAVFHDGQHRITAARSTVSQALFGDGGPGTSELPYLSAPLNPRDDQIWNDIAVTWGTADKQQTVRAADALSQRQNGIRTRSVETRLATKAAAQAMANALLARLKDPHVPFGPIQIDPTRAAGLWAEALTLEISDRITIVRRPNPDKVAVTKACYVEKIDHRVQIPNDGRNNWGLTLTVTAV